MAKVISILAFCNQQPRQLIDKVVLDGQGLLEALMPVALSMAANEAVESITLRLQDNPCLSFIYADGMTKPANSIAKTLLKVWAGRAELHLTLSDKVSLTVPLRLEQSQPQAGAHNVLYLPWEL